MNKQLRFNKLLYDEKFAALAIDQGTSLKNIIKEKKGKSFTQADYYFFKEPNGSLIIKPNGKYFFQTSSIRFINYLPIEATSFCCSIYPVPR